MSLPDTVFIFVLALIIFGPKKLPEIGRQLGKLVGEFRRASNEFKFQIEEELRQADLTERQDSEKTIAAPSRDVSRAMETLNSPIFPTPAQDPAESLPVGQHPNIESLDHTEYKDPGDDLLNSPAVEAATTPTSMPVVSPALGSLARTTVPYAAEANPANGTRSDAISGEAGGDSLPQAKLPASVNTNSSLSETEITHG